MWPLLEWSLVQHLTALLLPAQAGAGSVLAYSDTSDGPSNVEQGNFVASRHCWMPDLGLTDHFSNGEQQGFPHYA